MGKLSGKNPFPQVQSRWQTKKPWPPHERAACNLLRRLANPPRHPKISVEKNGENSLAAPKNENQPNPGALEENHQREQGEKSEGSYDSPLKV